MDIVPTIAKQYTVVDDWERKKLVLQMIAEMSNAANMLKMSKLSCTQAIVQDFVRMTKGENLTHDNLQSLLGALNKLAVN